MEAARIKGALAPVVTPFDTDLRPAGARLKSHCRWLIDNGVGLAVFGTNSEANSLSVPERRWLLEDLVTDGLPASRMMPGTGTCALPDTVELTRQAVELGCAGALMLPPFFYKGVSEDGLFASYSEVIQRVGDDRLRIYLYHIPQMTGVPILPGLIERLLKAYPGTIAGLKDSSGDWSNAQMLLETYQPDGFDVFPASESFLIDTLSRGGAGCISATANVNPGPIARLAANWQGADELQAAVDRVRKVFQGYVMIPAMKAAIAHHSGDREWRRCRPPVIPLNKEAEAGLHADLAAADFSMPGLGS